MFLVDIPGNFHRPGRTCKNIQTGDIFDDFTLLLMYEEGLHSVNFPFLITCYHSKLK